MADVLIEHGIGETRAAVLDTDGAIVEAHIERPGLRCGDVYALRVRRPERGRSHAEINHEAVVLDAAGLGDGTLVCAEVVREAIPERLRRRAARLVARPAQPQDRDGLQLTSGPDLAMRLRAAGHRLSLCAAHGADRLDAAGWGELIEQARTGLVAFTGGSLIIDRTAAFTAIDVDGDGEPVALAVAGAAAAARAIGRFGIGGSIAIDLPARDKASRAAATAAFDAACPPSFERTAVNGFGLLHVVRPKQRPSLLDRLQGDAVPSAALALLRVAERCRGTGPLSAVSSSAVAAWLQERPHLTAELARRSGRAVELRADEGLPMFGGHVH